MQTARCVACLRTDERKAGGVAGWSAVNRFARVGICVGCHALSHDLPALRRLYDEQVQKANALLGGMRA